MIYQTLYSLAVACVGAIIGWKLCLWAGKKAMREIVHRAALLLHLYGVRPGDVKKLMEVQLDDDDEVFRLVKKIQGQILRPDPSGGAEKTTVDSGTQGG